MPESTVAKAIKFGFGHIPHFARKAVIKSMITREELKCFLKAHQLQIPLNQIVGRKELLQRLGARRNGVCHIIGSGWSVLDGLHKISIDDSVYTCNFGGLLNLTYDLWFVEFAKPGDDRIGQLSLLQREVIDEQKTNIRNLIFKNIWGKNLNWDYIQSNYKTPYAVIKDVHFPISQERVTHEEIIDELVFPSRNLVVQYSSTVMTLIIIAFWRGFNKIIVHGLDGGGQYYFQRDDAVIPSHLSSSFQALFPKPTDATTTVHQANALIGPFISELAGKMEDFGVSLRSATLTSPLSRFLEVA